MIQDTACFAKDEPSVCVEDFCFFMIDSETGLSGDAGILGLGPPYAENGPSFFGTLWEQQGYTVPVTSWVLRSLPEESWVDFGSYNATYIVGTPIAH